MNNNQVISLPAKTTTQYAMGELVTVSLAGGKAVAGNLHTTRAVGVVLHDKDSTDSPGTPVDVRLFSAGGIVFLKVNATTAIAVGDPVGYETGVTGGKSIKNGSTNVGVALEAADADGDIIRVLL